MESARDVTMEEVLRKWHVNLEGHKQSPKR